MDRDLSARNSYRYLTEQKNRPGQFLNYMQAHEFKNKRALIIQGGWEGHEPETVAAFFADALHAKGYSVQVSDRLEVLDNAEALTKFDLIALCWTMGRLTETQSANLCEAVRQGTGLGGFHGGMGGAFLGGLNYDWMVGGHFVGHPYVGKYSVEVKNKEHPVTQELPDSFTYDSEQYYMMIDPGIEVLAETFYSHEGKDVRMPVIWTKTWGKGLVFYSALGHKAQEFKDYPDVTAMTIRGLLWATRKEVCERSQQTNH
jgi:type 1 glutamine amidotransferase